MKRCAGIVSSLFALGCVSALAENHSGAATTTEQLELLTTAAQVVSQRYLYPDFNGRDWPGAVGELRAKVIGGIDAASFYEGMRALIASIGDEHSYFQSPDDVARQASSGYVGIGVSVLPMLEKQRGAVLAVLPGSPAARGGLRAHDSILAIDGEPLVDGERARERLRGIEGSTVRVRVQSPGGVPHDVTLVRKPVDGHIPVEARTLAARDDAHVGYIVLPTFLDPSLPGRVREALEQFGPLDGLVIDLRMNGGGSSRALEPILRLFVRGDVGSFRSRFKERQLVVEPDLVHNSQSVPIVALIGPGTVSYAEVAVGILQDQRRATLVGQRTKGNVETLVRHAFADGSVLWLAEERFEPRHSHANWEGRGVTPDVEVTGDWDTFTFESDPGIAAALEILAQRRGGRNE